MNNLTTEQLDFYNKNLLDFLKDWLEAVQGDSKIPVMIRTHGLCSCFNYYLERVDENFHEKFGMYGDSFLESYYFSDTPIPFNLMSHGDTSYSFDNEKAVMHKNPKRLQWVKDTIKLLSEKYS